MNIKDKKEKYPIYFIMEDEYSNMDSFMRMSNEAFNLLWYEDKIQKIMILNEEQKRRFLWDISNNFNPRPSGDSSVWQFAGFRIKVIKGSIE